jgi:hypothetical protein
MRQCGDRIYCDRKTRNLFSETLNIFCDYNVGDLWKRRTPPERPVRPCLIFGAKMS